MSEVQSVNGQLLPFVERIRREVFLADQAWFLARTTGDRADTLNARGFGELAGVIQHLLADRIVLSVTNLFERPSRQHPSLSIPALVARVGELAGRLEVQHRPRVLRWLTEEAPHKGLVTDKDINHEIVRRLDRDIPSQKTVDAKTSAALQAIKTRRDKFITHSEVVSAESLPPVTWGDLNDLVRLAKVVLSLIGWTYLSEAYAPEIGHADHFLASDAERPAIALTRLLSAAGIDPDLRAG